MCPHSWEPEEYTMNESQMSDIELQELDLHYWVLILLSSDCFFAWIVTF